MNQNDILDWLIEEGCPSIAYRVRKELRMGNISEQEYLQYQQQISAEPKVLKVLSWQNPDGYFGTRLHTAPTGSKVWPHEGCVRYLLEMGLNNENVEKSLEVMCQPGWGKECEQSKAAQTFKFELIRASLFAPAGFGEPEMVEPWVEDALQAFRNIANAEHYMELVTKRPDHKLVFKEEKYIPVIYHLRILAFTDSWRTEENYKMLENAYQKLYQWLPLPPMYLKAKAYPVAPLGNLCAPVNQNFCEELGFIWLHFYEMSARMGMLGKNSPFRKHFEELKKVVLKQDEQLILYTKKRNGSYVGWLGYSGIALEGDGKTQGERIRDFMFRVMLIDKYSL